jgi:hypothetical protein
MPEGHDSVPVCLPCRFDPLTKLGPPPPCFVSAHDFSRAVRTSARSALPGSVTREPAKQAPSCDRTPALRFRKNPPNPQMCKTCQEGPQKSKVMTPHNMALTSLYPQRYLASLFSQSGILNIRVKEEKFLD